MAQPWDIVGMDLVGKLTPTKEGYQYICVMVDYFTKWCEAFPLKTKSAEEVTTCIIKHFYKFGAPKRLLTDQGTEFVNKVSVLPLYLFHCYIVVLILLSFKRNINGFLLFN